MADRFFGSWDRIPNTTTTPNPHVTTRLADLLGIDDPVGPE